MNRDDQLCLLQLAKESIQFGLQSHGHSRLKINSADYSDTLQQTASCFVTLTINNQLRGCIGNLEPFQALIQDVVYNAHSAAFNDPRFEPLQSHEFDQLQLHISVLNPAQELQFESEEQLLQQLNPGEDGLILECEGHRATFLPSVWDQLRDKKQFLLHLKRKAGLADDYWSHHIRAYKYTTESF